MKDKDVLWYDRKRVLWFPFTFTKYWIKNGRLYSQQGLFSTKYDELLLYRIIDISLERTFVQKIFGTGTIILTTRADNDKRFKIMNVTNSEKVKDLLSELIEESRNKKRVNGKEFFEINTGSDLENLEDLDN